jgi:monofunctional biosynthetic peptidoglycan transglycosylase
VLLASAALVAPWRWLPPPSSAFIVRDWALRQRVPEQRWVPRSAISANLAIAVIAAEDQKFPDHHGFDFDSIARAARESRERPRGASTISQQLAKNLFLWPGRSWVRKALEGYLTLWIEALWPKSRILEVYLNVVEFGPGVYGADAASRRYFGRPASRLTLREASTLAAVLPNPKRLSAASPSDYVRGRAAEIEGIARKRGRGVLDGL